MSASIKLTKNDRTGNYVITLVQDGFKIETIEMTDSQWSMLLAKNSANIINRTVFR